MSGSVVLVELDADGSTIRGFRHVPDTASAPVPAVLIIPGFADTAVGPHNMHVLLARELVRAGIAVMRFDYRGQGESDGEFSRFTVQSGLDDARRAIHELAASADVDSERLGVHGYSLGAAYAAALAAEYPEVRSLSLLSPVAWIDPVLRSFFDERHLRQASEHGFVDWLGWPVGGALLDRPASVDPLAAIGRAQAATLVVHGTADNEVSSENGRAYERYGAMLHEVPGAGHQWASVRIQDEVIARIVAWHKAALQTRS